MNVKRSISIAVYALLVSTSMILVTACGSSVPSTAEPVAEPTVATAATVPGAPTIGTATGGNGSVSVSFTAPSSNGDSAILEYTVSSTPGSILGSGSGSPITVSGLTNGTAYTFTVIATNAVGNSAASSASNSVTPAAPSTITFSPSSGTIGTLLTITSSDTDLSGQQGVAVNGVAAIVLSSSTTTITAMVMPQATTGTISVTTSAGTTTSTSDFTVSAASSIANQQGSKLVGTGGSGTAGQGWAVALSADGNTAISSGSSDNSNTGAVWVYTRSGTTWTQQGSKLVGTGATGSALQGSSVAISADGNTAAVGGYNDSGNVGAVWVFVRSGATWSQQGSKLTGSSPVGSSYQGQSVAISSDGNTLIVGGFGDDSNAGAAWVFTRTGTTWTQQGSKLVGTGASGAAKQGQSVAISADGNTAIVGGLDDNTSAGATWVYTRSGTTWTQQGSKLVGTGATGAAKQGHSVAISADGNTAIIGGFVDDSSRGAGWVFTRSGITWTQQGSKLTANSVAYQGRSIGLSADGNTAIIGGDGDTSLVGAVWVYTRSGTTWTVGSKLIGTGTGSAQPRQGSSCAISADASTVLVGGYGDNSSAGATWVFTP